ncbi:NCK-interacting protein with SH3 domain [Toxorhynchites rutilus septentrionalis]|uniref:NCK-interacting protein with SH3 domain n=1 Tax=Toxorhynchites rutilus septentrionalis TaxID=329112 RepID=UPI00247890A8|nr:NCK-interacting protein with SH3 domain [Toxorhynchites rutilus septentrionalis]
MMGDSLINEAESFEMLKALYDFTAVYPKTISFDEGEYFILHQTSARQRNWWQVVSMKGNIGFVPSNYVMKLKVDPNFLNGFLESSIESLRMSTDKEINGIIHRDELMDRLMEKKMRVEKLLKSEFSDNEEEQPLKMGNGSIRHLDDYSCNNCIDPNQNYKDAEYRRSPVTSKHEKLTKKSQSSPAVGATNSVPQFVQESPSMSILSSKLNQDDPATPTAQESSVLSEVSEAETTNTATTTTTTTTSDEITAISRGDEENARTELIAEPEIQTDHEMELEITNNDDMTTSENEPQPKESSAKEPLSEPDTIAESQNLNDISDARIEPQDVYQVVDAIRTNTSLSHEMACVALRVVLSELEPLLPPPVIKHLEPIAVHLTAPLDVPDALLAQTHDAQRLRVIFTGLSDCKNDSEQRTWMLHEDEADISRYLNELITILTDADPKICRNEMAVDHYQSVINLVLYYQMETRWSIRKLLLKAFKAMCHLDYTTVDILLGSVLPLEIVQDMISNARNVEKLQELANMLIIVFSIGRRMPVNQQEHLRSDFVIFLLNIIENPPDTDIHNVLSDTMINLILSFNLQFDNFADNVVLEAMEQIQTAKTFTEKILVLINREEDPVHTLKHTPAHINPVLKMLVDLFSRTETASIFYTNDQNVLIDILVRQLSDLSAGEPIRKWYLELCRKIVRNTRYSEHQHRKQDLMKIFTRIFCEETECSAGDQQIVREIANEFPQIFKA